MELAAYLPPRLLDEYQPLALLQDRGWRQTLLLRHRRTGLQIICKRASDKQSQLQDEHQLLRQLAGPGIPESLQVFQENGWTYLLRIYVPGETLLDYAQKRGPLPAREVRNIGQEICAILRRLHRQDPPVIHRDIKLENIIRTPEGQLYLIDFGISRRFEAGACRDTQVLGTPASAPPEQFGFRQTDARSDVYALGVLLHELAAGTPFLDQGTVPPVLQPVIQRCTRFAPEDRYPDAAAVGLALRRAPLAYWAHRFGPLTAVLTAAVLAAIFLPPVIADAVTAYQIRQEAAAAAIRDAEPYVFASSTIEAEVCRQLGQEPGQVTRGDLAQIETLLLCGGQFFDRWERLTATGSYVALDGVQVIEAGAVDTLEDLAQMPNLRVLALASQNISDLTPLAQCTGLVQLCLANNAITDLSPLAACGELQELTVSGNPVSDFSPLAQCAKLSGLNAGATALTDLQSLSGLDNLTLLQLHDIEKLEDISTLSALPKLRTLFLRPVTAPQLETILSLPEIRELFLWHVQGMADLTPLAQLPHLTYLFLHQDTLASLEGAGDLAQVQTLQILCAPPLDLSPLTEMPKLSTLLAAGLTVSDWTPLDDCGQLVQAQCTADQADAIRQALGEPEFQLVV